MRFTRRKGRPVTRHKHRKIRRHAPASWPVLRVGGATLMNKDTEIFESHRPDLLTLAYRMLGEMGRAEDAVQEAWVRWQKRTVEVDSPRAYLVKVVTRLCLNELDSARARREESRPDRLPE